MPGGMNGAELAVEACRRQPGLKVLFASGYSENAISAAGALKRGSHYIAKPYQQDDLARKFREVLDGDPSPALQPPVFCNQRSSGAAALS
jgi:DNA-binding LytR/AlgR family response regulator